MKPILMLYFVAAMLPLSQAAPTLIETSHTQFLHIREEGEDKGDYFVKLNQIVSIEVEKSKRDDGSPFDLTIHTTAISGVPGSANSSAYSTSRSYCLSFKTKAEADHAANQIMQFIAALNSKK
jgi:hypothetical protein